MAVYPYVLANVQKLESEATIISDQHGSCKYRPLFASRRRTMIVGIGLVTCWLVYRIESYLAQQSPILAKTLVVETWFSDESTVREVAALVKSHGYERVVAVGMDADLQDAAPGDATTFVAMLRKCDIGSADLVTLEFPYSARHRTYANAVAVRQWIVTSGVACDAINVFTVGVHGRKSLILFRKALEPEVKVGIISGAPTEYRPAWWFCSPQGVYLVARNTVGYLYALAFQPDRPLTRPLPDGPATVAK